VTISELVGAALGGGALTQVGNFLAGRRRAASDEATLYRTALAEHVGRLDATIAQQNATIAGLQERVGKLEHELNAARSAYERALGDAELLAQERGRLLEREREDAAEMDALRARVTVAEARALAAEQTAATLESQLEHERAHHSGR
jgi:chromosome segregation ATPase